MYTILRNGNKQQSKRKKNRFFTKNLRDDVITQFIIKKFWNRLTTPTTNIFVIHALLKKLYGGKGQIALNV